MREAWLEGPVEGVPALLMPVAHALLQARTDLESACAELQQAALAEGPGGAASVGFHLRHIGGSLDRLRTYARGATLSAQQRAALAEEVRDDGRTAAQLLAAVSLAIDATLAQVRATPEAALLDARAVGRAGLPSTVLGLLFHLAEHTQRHVGQVIATAKVVRGA